MNTKADLSFNVIIVAIIGLIVLVIIVSIFSGKSSDINNELNACLGSCISKKECNDLNGQINYLSNKWCEHNERAGTVCCITLQEKP